MEGNIVEITASYPAGKIGTTAENLKAAAAGENEEWTILYPSFAEIAAKEGFPKIATAFKLITKVEVEHEKRYLKLLKNIEDNKVFEDDEEVEWFAANAAIYIKARKLWRIALLAVIRKPTSKEKQKITKERQSQVCKHYITLLSFKERTKSPVITGFWFVCEYII